MKTEVVCGKLIKQSGQGNSRQSKQQVYEKDLEVLLHQRYPALFADRTLPSEQTCMCRGMASGDGWFDLIDLLCSMIQLGSALTRTIRRPCASRRSRRNLACCAFTFATLKRGTGQDRYGCCTVSGDFETVRLAINPLW